MSQVVTKRGSVLTKDTSRVKTASVPGARGGFKGERAKATSELNQNNNKVSSSVIGGSNNKGSFRNISVIEKYMLATG